MAETKLSQTAGLPALPLPGLAAPVRVARGHCHPSRVRCARDRRRADGAPPRRDCFVGAARASVVSTSARRHVVGSTRASTTDHGNDAHPCATTLMPRAPGRPVQETHPRPAARTVIASHAPRSARREAPPCGAPPVGRGPLTAGHTSGRQARPGGLKKAAIASNARCTAPPSAQLCTDGTARRTSEVVQVRPAGWAVQTVGSRREGCCCGLYCRTSPYALRRRSSRGRRQLRHAEGRRVHRRPPRT